VTVLFADLKGSMALLADRDPEEARELLDPALERMMEAVHRYEGTVNQVMGDGIMALFGAPLAHEDHALRACYAALRMQEAVRDYEQELRRTLGVSLSLRVGINSGDVVVRTISNDLRMDYTAVGQSTHLAARMEQLATPGTIFVTADTARLVEGLIELRTLGPTPVKGLSSPIEVFQAVRAGASRSRLAVAAGRGLTRFVGRDAEIAVLHASFVQVQRGHGQLVAIVGEPGIGKSRLCWEFGHGVRELGRHVLEASALSYERTTPFTAVLAILGRYFELETADSAQHIREKVIARVLALDRGLEVYVAPILDVLGVAGEAQSSARLDGPERRRRALEAIRRLLIRESRERPLLLVIEDLQWVDAETNALIDALVESLSAARIMLVITYRPEYQHPWANRTYYHQIQVGPLVPQTVNTMLRDLLGDDASLSHIKRLLAEKADGNPFFLEEGVRVLVQSGFVTGERGSYRPMKPVSELQVPATVHAVLASRIDRLPPNEKRLLQCAAVIGKDVPFSLLQAIADVAAPELRTALAHLQSMEFLYEKEFFPNLQYTFAHALTHEVAYGSILHEHRRVLHRRITEAIECAYGDAISDHVERLAHHALQGHLWEKAFHYLRQAGIKAFARAANRAAVEYFERALRVLEHLPTSPASAADAIDLRLELRSVWVALGQFQRVRQCLEEAEALARLALDERRLVLVQAYRANYLQITGEADKAVDYGQRALRRAVELKDSDLELLANSMLSGIYFVLGDFPQAIECGTNTVEAVAKASHHRVGMASLPSVYSRLALVRSLSETGDFAAALARAEESVVISISASDSISASLAYFGLGYVYLRQGSMHPAVVALERAYEFSRAANDIWLQQIASTLAAAHLGSGTTTRAFALLDEAAAHALTMGSEGYPLGLGVRLAVDAEAFAAVGRLGDAVSRIHEAVEVFRRRKSLGYEAWALYSLGVILVRADDDARRDESAAAVRASLQLAERLGMRPLFARCLLALGEACFQAGRLDEARETFTRAATEASRLGMLACATEAQNMLTTMH
jgi:class 3 adenylate cyclase/tetratricopeptide (TPR) repeat protein